MPGRSFASVPRSSLRWSRRCLTPVPEDSEFPWLFYDQIRAATDDTLRMAGNLELAQTLGAVDAQAIIGPIAKSMDKMSQSITQSGGGCGEQETLELRVRTHALSLAHLWETKANS